MKTFLEIIQSSDDDVVLKSYIVEGSTIDFTARQFKALFKMDDRSYTTIKHVDDGPDFVGKLRIDTPNMVSISVTKECVGCQGEGEYECIECSGTGDCECDTCGSEHACGICAGYGLIGCEECQEYNFIEDEISFYCEIDINQGELFV